MTSLMKYEVFIFQSVGLVVPEYCLCLVGLFFLIFKLHSKCQLNEKLPTFKKIASFQ